MRHCPSLKSRLAPVKGVRPARLYHHGCILACMASHGRVGSHLHISRALRASLKAPCTFGQFHHACMGAGSNSVQMKACKNPAVRLALLDRRMTLSVQASQDSNPFELYPVSTASCSHFCLTGSGLSEMQCSDDCKSLSV